MSRSVPVAPSHPDRPAPDFPLPAELAREGLDSLVRQCGVLLRTEPHRLRLAGEAAVLQEDRVGVEHAPVVQPAHHHGEGRILENETEPLLARIQFAPCPREAATQDEGPGGGGRSQSRRGHPPCAHPRVPALRLLRPGGHRKGDDRGEEKSHEATATPPPGPRPVVPRPVPHQASPPAGGFPAAGALVGSADASITSRTLAARVLREKGFCRNTKPSSSIPWWEIAASG